ncbi:uncharacterized protein LOC120144313, partial [Hibiscus syriacus]|uniref:uncharacterized protein LOC120144313 n=1 Tax=Hibiscus syriacus TaxID=106335 RepID=UPI001920AA12
KKKKGNLQKERKTQKENGNGDCIQFSFIPKEGKKKEEKITVITPTKSSKLLPRPSPLAFVPSLPEKGNRTIPDYGLKNLQCGESVTIEGQTYMISAVTHRYQLRKGKYEPSEKRLDVLSTGRYILNLYLESLLEQS